MSVNDLIAPLSIMLTANGRLSIPQIAKLFGTSEEDIFDALEILVFCFDSVDTRLELTQNTATLITDEETQTLRLSEGETLVFIEALEKFGVSKDDQLMQQLIKAKGYFTDEALAKSKISTTHKTGGGSFAALLASACEDIEHRLLEVEYQSNNQASPSKRIVEPYTIVVRDGHSYLRCFLHENGEQRSFRFDRIKNVKQLDECFEPKAWNDEASEPVYAYIKFAPGADIPEWPDSQLVDVEDDGSNIVEVKWLGGLWLSKQIASQLGCAKIIDPPQLKQATHEYVEKLLKNLD